MVIVIRYHDLICMPLVFKLGVKLIFVSVHVRL